jgi:hypothetical protein
MRTLCSGNGKEAENRFIFTSSVLMNIGNIRTKSGVVLSIIQVNMDNRKGK